MDEDLTLFSNLQVLNLSHNKITKVCNLPPNLRELNLTGNFIDEVAMLRAPHDSLIHLGLAYNRIRNNQLFNITRNFPGLFSLDLSFNELENFSEALTHLETLNNSIRILFLVGNPLYLSNQFKDIIK